MLQVRVCVAPGTYTILNLKKYLSTCIYKYAYKFKKMIAPRRVEKRLEAACVGGGTWRNSMRGWLGEGSRIIIVVL